MTTVKGTTTVSEPQAAQEQPAAPQAAPVPQAAQAPAPPPFVPTEADRMWAEIKNKPISLFALAGKRVCDYCSPHPIEPSKLFLTAKASSLLPELEAVIGPAYVCEKQDRFIVVSRAPKPLGSK